MVVYQWFVKLRLIFTGNEGNEWENHGYFKIKSRMKRSEVFMLSQHATKYSIFGKSYIVKSE